jgi:hypothetical protein
MKNEKKQGQKGIILKTIIKFTILRIVRQNGVVKLPPGFNVIQ